MRKTVAVPAVCVAANMDIAAQPPLTAGKAARAAPVTVPAEDLQVAEVET